VGDTKVGYEGAENSATPVWQAPEIELELHDGDVVSFEILDDDSGDPGDTADDEPDFIYGCSTQVNIGSIASGRLRCMPDFPSLAPLSVTARIAPRDEAP